MFLRADFAAATREVRRSLESVDAIARLWSCDHTLWQPDPLECANRLGWLDEPGRAERDADQLIAARAQLAAQGIDRVIWSGMGGSSLFPELLAHSELTGIAPLDLRVIDTVCPATVRRATAAIDPATTLLVFASKSGGTIETRTHLDVFTTAHPDARVAVITDPGSAFEQLALERGWECWRSNPDIGGRFSALSRFGTVAAALLGIDPRLLARPAADMANAARAATGNAAFELAVFLAAAHALGRDKLTLVAPPSMPRFGAWVEQLVAESTGKHGVGLLPVVDEPLGDPCEYANDRCFVTYGDVERLAELRAAGNPVFDLGDAGAASLGAEAMRWMLATSWLGAALGINPFDQPDVESAKRAALATLQGTAPSTPSIGDPAALLESLAPGDHIVIQAFVDPESTLITELGALRLRLRARYRCAVTVGTGPRYLHSTGQLHKGGPNTGVFVQIVEPGDDDLEVPGRGYTLATLLHAQADGDHGALQAAGRRVVRAAAPTVLALA